MMMERKKSFFRPVMWMLTGFVLSAPTPGFVYADGVAVIPLFSIKGDAEPADVLKGQTFSSRKGRNLVGTLEIDPAVQTITADFGMTFNLIPLGTFTMGSPEDEPGRDETAGVEKTHVVSLTGSFYMQRTEVTRAQWRDVVRAAVWNEILEQDALNESPSLPVDESDDTYPVNNVSWSEVNTWIAALNKLTPGKTYNLPTEAQWEYAARGGTSTPWACGEQCDDSDDGSVTDGSFNANLDMMGWYTWHDSWESGYTLRAARPVARKQPNPWGLFDMHGNVAEWCADYYDIYRVRTETDPQGPATGAERVVRGGSFQDEARDTRSAARDSLPPSGKNLALGFRLVLEPGP